MDSVQGKLNGSRGDGLKQHESSHRLVSVVRLAGAASLIASTLLIGAFQPAATLEQESASPAGRAAPLVLTPHKLGALELEMSAKAAVGTGYLKNNPDEPCGHPAEVIDKHATVLFIGWNDDDTIDNIFIKGRSVARTKAGVGVRSTVAEMREGHRRLLAPQRVEGDGGRFWMQALRRGGDWLIFGLSTPENQRPSPADRVNFMYIDQDWAPRDGLHGGC